MSGPRLPPLGNAELAETLRPVLAAWPYRLHRTLAHSPESLERWMPWAEHILLRNRLPPRAREILILRVAWNARSAYEWGMHAMVARRVGLGQADLAAVVEGPESAHWSPGEAAIVRAADELMATHRLSDATWGLLARHHEPAALVDLVWLAGQFATIAWLLNALRVEPEDGLDPLPTGPGGP
ncbi:carboxymuconolactone decarboxylase family protein [Thermaurantiacus sp.]